MKIIDLLNKIANGEEVPNKIKYKSVVLYYHKEEQDYERYWGSCLFEHLFKMYDTKSFINDEIEIIEEPKKIENIILDSEECIEYYEDGIKKHLNTNKKDKMYVKVLNEIIDYINSKEE